MINNLEIGWDTSELSKALEQFAKYLAEVDRKLAGDTQKIILRNAIKNAVKSLRQETKTTWKKHTGNAVKSVGFRVKASKTRKGVYYATYGWRGKRKKRAEGDTRKGRVIAPPASQYIGIWNDLGTKNINGKHVFNAEWLKQKNSIQKDITEAIQGIIKQNLLNKLH